MELYKHETRPTQRGASAMGSPFRVNHVSWTAIIFVVTIYSISGSLRRGPWLVLPITPISHSASAPIYAFVPHSSLCLRLL